MTSVQIAREQLALERAKRKAVRDIEKAKRIASLPQIFKACPAEAGRMYAALQAKVARQHIYLVQGEHWSIPGRRERAYATKKDAKASALEMVNDLLKDACEENRVYKRRANLSPATDYEDGLTRLQAWLNSTSLYDEDDADVWITELALR